MRTIYSNTSTLPLYEQNSGSIKTYKPTSKPMASCILNIDMNSKTLSYWVIEWDRSEFRAKRKDIHLPFFNMAVQGLIIPPAEASMHYSTRGDTSMGTQSFKCLMWPWPVRYEQESRSPHIVSIRKICTKLYCNPSMHKKAIEQTRACVLLTFKYIVWPWPLRYAPGSRSMPSSQ